MAKAMIALIRLYQCWVSPLLGNNCRFTPSCSQYAIEALRGHGMLYGTALTIGRVLRCQPFCHGGHDPVPEALHRLSRPHGRTRP